MGVFRFKQFDIQHDKNAMKVGTDGVVLGAWADVPGAKRILDIGSGTGLIAMMCAQRNLNAQIDAVEIDSIAYSEMVSNFKRTPWHNRLNAFEGDIKDYQTADGYDLIVTNPPFFVAGTSAPDLSRGRARHTSHLSPEDLVMHIIRLLNVNGKACVILPYAEGKDFTQMCRKKGLHLTKETSFLPYADKPTERLLLQFENEPKNLVQNTIVHYNEDRSWHESYKTLTQAFHPML
ncbi:methyltransferase domain-containing protein [Fulvivirga sp. RKSG066]|uniref:tRNA1(Val) (adenine(37)-N6)-methyltransferase n=1 Tax=Fulvivirga aurantia TaxID=2529383 RepID=UPI0012BCFA89|nr:methyltransferase [Fulvivirga aurantia]MTI22346.1 methyltransferase domain-containing protein [Fulvivirga aurantia]